MTDKKKASKSKQTDESSNKKDTKALEAEIQTKLIAELRSQIKEDKDKIVDLKKSNQDLKDKLSNINQEILATDTAAKSKIDMQKSVTDKQRIKIQEKTYEFDNIKKELLKKYEDGRIAISKKYDDERKRMEEIYQKLNTELQSLESYRKEKTKKEKELTDIKENYAMLSKQIQNQKFDVEKATTKEMQSIKSKYEVEVTESKKNAMQKAFQDLNIAEKKILQLNEHLREDIEMQNDEVQYLREKESEAEDYSKKYKRDMMINMEKVDSYSKRQTELSKKLKELKYELELKNQTLKDYAKEFEKDKELTRFKYNSRISELQVMNQKLSQQLTMKNTEYKNIKRLANIILQQRSEVETFFLEALEQVKEEIKKKNALNKKTNIPDQAEEKQYGDKVDLKDLELEDRERVIRLLFAKMNAGTTPQIWKNNTSKIQQSYEDDDKKEQNKKSYEQMHEDYNPWAIENE